MARGACLAVEGDLAQMAERLAPRGDTSGSVQDDAVGPGAHLFDLGQWDADGDGSGGRVRDEVQRDEAGDAEERPGLDDGMGGGAGGRISDDGGELACLAVGGLDVGVEAELENLGELRRCCLHGSNVLFRCEWRCMSAATPWPTRSIVAADGSMGGTAKRGPRPRGR